MITKGTFPCIFHIYFVAKMRLSDLKIRINFHLTIDSHLSERDTIPLMEASLLSVTNHS